MKREDLCQYLLDSNYEMIKNVKTGEWFNIKGDWRIGKHLQMVYIGFNIPYPEKLLKKFYYSILFHHVYIDSENYLKLRTSDNAYKGFHLDNFNENEFPFDSFKECVNEQIETVNKFYDLVKLERIKEL